MAQRNFDKFIAPELRQFVSIAIKQERAFNSFRKDANDLVAFEHKIGILLTRDDAAQLCMKVEEKWKLDQSGMNQKPDIAPNIPNNEVQRHDGIPRHETSMHAD